MNEAKFACVSYMFIFHTFTKYRRTCMKCCINVEEVREVCKTHIKWRVLLY